jgi:hypothetical protein
LRFPFLHSLVYDASRAARPRAARACASGCAVVDPHAGGALRPETPMKLHELVLALALFLLAGAPAFAADQSLDLSSGQASFIGSAALFDGGDDVITFTGVAPGTYSVWLSVSAQDVSGLAVILNGQPANVDTAGVFRFAYLDTIDDAPFVLTLFGVANGARSGYSGELSIALIPEPGTLALLGAGLGLLALRGRRQDG